MRIASYNLFEGARDTSAQLEDFVVQQEIDVLSIQEANGWQDGDPSRLDQFAKNTGMESYVYGDSNSRFKLAVFSRLPIISSTVYREGLHHCAVEASVEVNKEPLHIWNVHLSPYGEDQRLAEVKLLAKNLKLEESTLINGDFNSLSQTDLYPSTLLSELRERGMTKFGVDHLRYDVTRYLGGIGLIDLAAAMDVATATVPTPVNSDASHAANLRLDYMFASQSLAGLVERVTVPKDSLTDVISDHYPIVTEL